MVHIIMIVHGRVQGVGFRYMTKMVADQLGILGIARNEEDGSVYIEASGEETKIKTFIEAVKKSPSPSGRVENLEISYPTELPPRKKFYAQ